MLSLAFIVVKCTGTLIFPTEGCFTRLSHQNEMNQRQRGSKSNTLTARLPTLVRLAETLTLDLLKTKSINKGQCPQSHCCTSSTDEQHN